MLNTTDPSRHRLAVDAEPDRRQQLAMERIEFAIAELATAVPRNCRSDDVARTALQDVRKAVTPVFVDILAAD
jgi:hypothetical protein